MARTALIGVRELAERLAGTSPPTVIELRQAPGDPGPRIRGAVGTTLHDGFAMIRPERQLQYDLPSPAEFAGTLGGLGVTPGTGLVLADDMGNRWATRAYWLLRYYRHPGDFVVVDGGIRAYIEAGLPTDEINRVADAAAYPTPTVVDETIRATADDVVGAIAGEDASVCDVRTLQEHSGEVALSGRGGHIPRSTNVPWDECIDASGRFKNTDELRHLLRDFIDRETPPITYCQGGIRASLVWFVLEELLGHPARLYAASWEEWAQRPELPVSA